MRIITRYLLRAFIGPLLLCLVAFNMIFIIFDLFGHLSRFIDSKAEFGLILRYYVGVVCMYSHWFIPASCMLATLYTMWQLSHHSELTAMRASGISFERLTVPFFSVAVLMSLLIFVNSEYVIPEASTWSNRLKDASFSLSEQEERRNLQYLDPVTRRNWQFTSVDTASEASMSRPSGPVEVKQDINGVNVWGVRAKGAFFSDGVWWFYSPREIKFDIDGAEVLTPARPADETGPSIKPMYELTETPRAMLLKQRDWEFYSLSDMFRHLQVMQIADRGKWYEFWYRLAAPWACVVITLFAIPAGISTGRQSVIKGVIMALTAFFSFYALTLVLNFLGHHGGCPPVVAALMPNFIFLCLGSFMYRKLT